MKALAQAKRRLASLSRERRNQAGGVVSRPLGRNRGTGRLVRHDGTCWRLAAVRASFTPAWLIDTPVAFIWSAIARSARP